MKYIFTALVITLTGCTTLSDAALPRDANGAQRAAAYTVETYFFWKLLGIVP
jgi:hypothetical protein